MKHNYIVKVIYTSFESRKAIEYECLFNVNEKMTKREAAKEAESIVEIEKYYIEKNRFNVWVRYELLVK